MKKNLLLGMVLIFGISFVGISTAIACDDCCDDCCAGTGTPGYWKNHPEAWPHDEICLTDEICFSKEEAIQIMDGPVAGDKSITLFKAFVAAKLNVQNGACGVPDCVDPVWGPINIGDANSWLQIFPVGSGVRANSEAWQASHGEAIYFCLDDYNNGLQPGVPSRDTTEDGLICSD